MRILIVDDDKNICETIKEFLIEVFCFQVETANNGIDGLVKFLAFKPHVVLLDYAMPGMSGIELTKKIRETNAHCYIIMMTCVATMELSCEAFRAGVNDFFAKPFEIVRFEQVIMTAKAKMGLIETLEIIEKKQIERAMFYLDDDVSSAASRLGINKTTIYRKMKAK